jgi:hypothetical protein
MPPHLHIRFARDAEAVLIGQMVHGSHDAVPAVAWEAVNPFWLVAEQVGEVIGCVQLCYSRPIGRLEFLSFLPSLPYRTRALAVRRLLDLGCVTLRMHGASSVAGCVPFTERAWRDILKDNGCRVLSSGNVMVKEVAA